MPCSECTPDKFCPKGPDLEGGPFHYPSISRVLLGLGGQSLHLTCNDSRLQVKGQSANCMPDLPSPTACSLCVPPVFSLVHVWGEARWVHAPPSTTPIS